MVGAVRISNGRTEKSSFIIIDAQSVKNTDTAEKKGYDAGKKVSGIKQHIAVDMQGMPHFIHITTADVGDRAGALEAVDKAGDTLENVINALVHGGYILVQLYNFR